MWALSRRTNVISDWFNGNFYLKNVSIFFKHPKIRTKPVIKASKLYNSHMNYDACSSEAIKDIVRVRKSAEGDWGFWLGQQTSDFESRQLFPFHFLSYSAFYSHFYNRSLT